MSVAGVALATVISETISASLVIRCMMKEKGSIRLTPSKLRIHPKRFAEILRIGLPASLQGVILRYQMSLSSRLSILLDRRSLPGILRLAISRALCMYR